MSGSTRTMMRTCEKCKKSTIALKDGVCVHCYRKLGSHERVEELTLEEHVRRNYPIGAGVKWKYGTYLAQKEPRTVIRLSWSNRMLIIRNQCAARFDLYDEVYFEHKGQKLRGMISALTIDPYGGGWYYDLLVNNEQYGRFENDIWR